MGLQRQLTILVCLVLIPTKGFVPLEPKHRFPRLRPHKTIFNVRFNPTVTIQKRAANGVNTKRQRRRRQPYSLGLNRFAHARPPKFQASDLNGSTSSSPKGENGDNNDDDDNDDDNDDDKHDTPLANTTHVNGDAHATHETTTTPPPFATSNLFKSFSVPPLNWQIPYYEYAMTAKADASANTTTNGKQHISIQVPASIQPSSSSSIIPPSGKSKQDTVTIQDLEEILRLNGYVKRAELEGDTLSRRNDLETNNQINGASAASSLGSGQVAFPQESVASPKDIMVGTTISSTLLFMVLSTTILPNLWLMGMLFGALVGYEVSRPPREGAENDAGPPNAASRLLLSMGRRVANAYLKVYDTWNGMWFMYKTGQLSYAYWKRYAQLDQRFAITEKVDAWNARFQQGKINFDRWEKENEVGRKILAGLRTVWLVEEKSLKQGRKRNGNSRYRLVQYTLDVVGWVRRFFVGCWNLLTGGSSEELNDLFRGIRILVWDAEDLGPRIGAAFVAWCVLNMVGAVFAVTPTLFGFLAIVMGLVWPSWTGELRQRLVLLREELQAQGRLEHRIAMGTASTAAAATKTSRDGKVKTTPRSRLVDKSKYSFYVKEDGSKRWYRTGQSQFSRKRRTKKEKKKKKRTGNSWSLPSLWKGNPSPPTKDHQWGLLG